MKTFRTHHTVALLGILALAACDEASSPSEPQFEDLLNLSEEMELSVLADDASIEIALSLVDAGSGAAMMRRPMNARSSRDLGDQARARFADARAALDRGDRREAVDLARDARRMVARGVAAAGGNRAVSSMIEHIEDMAINANDDDFMDARSLSAELNGLAGAARSAMNRGDMMGAGERAILGEQRGRNRRGRDGRRDHVTVDRAELAIALGAHAVSLADRLLEDGANDEQLRFLETANEFLEMAREALASGEYARAVHLAQLAGWNALKAVVLPDGVTPEEAREMVDLAKSLLIDAAAAIGDAPSELETQLLDRAGRLIELAETMLEEGRTRGIGAAWHSAVISSYLIG